jgi:hypothetical protein
MLSVVMLSVAALEENFGENFLKKKSLKVKSGTSQENKIQ